ncbi:MAG: hypothetical protein KKC51_08025 [Verrucomicrobia bacterium]|nr:hypothetical protein [Verrucomicrobiota bacterium]
MDKKKTDREKKTYSRPRLRTVELAASEVLTEGCKTAAGSAPFGAPPCWSNSCNVEGS